MISNGQVVFKKATSGDVDSAEAVGIIRKIKEVESESSNETEHYINIVFNGHIDFEELVFIENETLSETNHQYKVNLLTEEHTFLEHRGVLQSLIHLVHYKLPCSCI